MPNHKIIRDSDGLTFIELLVALAIAAILVGIALPSFRSLIRSVQVASAVNTFLADARFARSEAVRRGGSVVLCRSEAPEALSPLCSDGSNSTGWTSGWIVFQDLGLLAAGGDKNVDDPVLRVQAAIPGIGAIVGSQSPVDRFRFTSTGRLLGDASGLDASLTFGAANDQASEQRVVCIGLGGRAKIAGDGLQAC
jgi:type IV fimbrial biogenesis protein FimT